MQSPMSSPLEAALSTLQAQAESLNTLISALKTDEALTSAISLLAGVKGRVIVTGVGKSGHIGGKIAATLASTGTPAFFVHPTEALHGDLGMITTGDVIIALSHSGESKELAAILTYATRFGIPLIAVTGRPESTLAKAATIILNTRVEREACPLNLAPTTSTLIALALCDALAVALMTSRGFTKEDFAIFHPGGKLGAQLMRVSEVMVTENLPLQPSTASMAEVLVSLTARNLGCVGLTDAHGNLIGIFTDGDLKRRLTPDLLSQTASDIMTLNPRSIAPSALATTAVAQMESQNVTSLWVVAKEGPNMGKPVGLLRVQDCLHANII